MAKERTVAEWRKLLTLSYGQKGITIKGIKEEVSELIIPEKIGSQPVVAIDAYAFHCCSSLTRVEIPDSVTKIGCSAFESCRNLVDLVLPKSLKPDIHAFRGCPGLADKNGFVIVNGKLFNYYGAEINLTIPNTVERIAPFAFVMAKGITSVILPESIHIIDAYAFGDCANLISVTIPDSVMHIDDQAFKRCDKLVIHTPEGSFAEKYARTMHIPLQ